MNKFNFEEFHRENEKSDRMREKIFSKYDIPGFDSQKFTEDLNKQFNEKFGELKKFLDQLENNDFAERAKAFNLNSHFFDDEKYYNMMREEFENGRESGANPFANDMFTNAYPPNDQWKTYTAKPPVVIPDGYVHVSGNLVAPPGWSLRQKTGAFKGCRPITMWSKTRINPYRYFHVTGIETINFEMV